MSADQGEKAPVTPPTTLEKASYGAAGSLPERSDSDKVSTSSSIPPGMLSKFKARFGWKLLVLGFASQLVVTGFTASLSTKADNFLLISYKVPAPQMTLYTGAISMVTSVLPVIGLASDAFPIAGRRRGPYAAVVTVAGVAGLGVLGFVPQSVLPVQLAVVCLILIALQYGTTELLFMATFAEKIRETPEFGPDAVLVIGTGELLFALLASVASGPIIQDLGTKWIYAICMAPAAAVLVPALLDFYGEQRSGAAGRAQIRRPFREHPELAWLALAMCAGSGVITCSSLVSTGFMFRILLSSCVAGALMVLFSIFLCPAIARPAAFLFLLAMGSLSTDSASVMFFTATPEQLPDGPHFSRFFWLTTMSAIRMSVGGVGLLIYRFFFSGFDYRRILVICFAGATACRVFGAIFLMKGLAKSMGADPRVYMIANTCVSIMFETASMLSRRLLVVNLCPGDSEATVYALVMGLQSVGKGVASNYSAFLLSSFGVMPKGTIGSDETADFANLWKAEIIFAILPLLAVVSFLWLIPSSRQFESAIGDLGATSGSWWARAKGRQAAKRASKAWTMSTTATSAS